MSYQDRRIWADESQQGLTIIEILVTIFIIGTVVVGVFSLFLLSLQTAHESESRVVAIALANEKSEMVRNLPYSGVGTVGGIPSGSIPHLETVIRNGQSYNVKTDIRYIDDPYDGTYDSAPPDTVNTDYKQARIEVSWSAPRQAAPVLLITDIAPQGVESQDSSGTLLLHVVDALMQPVPRAAVTLQNATVLPVVNIQTETDDNGNLLLPGLEPAANSYRLLVTKTGYTTEQTYDPTASFAPAQEYSHISALVGQLTEKTFAIDVASSLEIHTKDQGGSAIGSVAHLLKGTKSIGTTGIGSPPPPVLRVESNQTTDVNGVITNNGLIWDTYDVTIDGNATGYDLKESDPPLPLTLSPGTNLTLTLTLVPHTPASLQVTVLSPTGTPVDNATVHLTETVSGTDITLGTGVLGQVLFSDLPMANGYSITIDAPGYTQAVDSVNVSGTNRYSTKLTPVS